MEDRRYLVSERNCLKSLLLPLCGEAALLGSYKGLRGPVSAVLWPVSEWVEAASGKEGIGSPQLSATEVSPAMAWRCWRPAAD